jgi:hypothetical protein
MRSERRAILASRQVGNAGVAFASTLLRPRAWSRNRSSLALRLGAGSPQTDATRRYPCRHAHGATVDRIFGYRIRPERHLKHAGLNSAERRLNFRRSDREAASG